MSFQFLWPYLNYILGLLVILTVLYIRSFTSEKAKNGALLKDIKKLTEEKESVVAKYQKELEEIKKQHDLDIAKRKYQYESKRDAYIKFLTFLDNYNAQAAAILPEKFFSITEKFMKGYRTSVNSQKRNAQITEYFAKTMELTQNGYSDYNKLKQETNMIRLSASDNVLKNLEDLEQFTKASLDEATFMMEKIPKLIEWNDKELRKEHQEFIETLTKDIETQKKYLIKFMRLDLDYI